MKKRTVDRAVLFNVERSDSIKSVFRRSVQCCQRCVRSKQRSYPNTCAYQFAVCSFRTGSGAESQSAHLHRLMFERECHVLSRPRRPNPGGRISGVRFSESSFVQTLERRMNLTRRIVGMRLKCLRSYFETRLFAQLRLNFNPVRQDRTFGAGHERLFSQWLHFALHRTVIADVLKQRRPIRKHMLLH